MKYARTRVDTDGIHNIYESTWPRDASKKRKIIAIVNDSCIGGLTAVAQAKGGKCKRVFRLSSEDLRPRVEFRTVREACRIAAILAVMVRNRIRAADRKLGACRA
jgi:hypothetical protein